MVLLSDHGVSSYDIGDGFGHFAIATQDVRLSTIPSQKLEHVFYLVKKINEPYMIY